MHVARRVRTAARERDNVVDDVAAAWPAARSCRRTGVRSLEFRSRAAAADRPNVGTVRDQQPEQDRRNYLNDGLSLGTPAAPNRVAGAVRAPSSADDRHNVASVLSSSDSATLSATERGKGQRAGRAHARETEAAR
jgi:hypothetical protein